MNQAVTRDNKLSEFIMRDARFNLSLGNKCEKNMQQIKIIVDFKYAN